MIEESNNEKENENQYKDRFGISYSSSRSTKGIIRINKFGSKKNIQKIKLNRGITYKSYLNFKKKNSYNKKKKIIDKVEEIELNRIYNKSNLNENEKIIPIENFNKVSKCSIIKYGVKKSTEKIEYSYCKTCDHNLVRPICLHCINKCHSGHATNFIFRKGRIKCSCGEKNHYIVKINYNVIIKNIICLGNEWNITSKLGFYYINKKNKPICILCHNYCESNNKKDKIIKLEDKKTVLECSCKNEEIHGSHRAICEKIINLITDYNEFHILLHPIQFINMLFISNNNFKYIFEDFEIFNNNINNENSKEYFLKFRSIDITNTNIYKTLLIFEKMVQKKAKNNYIYYYNEKVLNYFSFKVIKSLYTRLEELSLEKSFRIMINKYLYLFHKLYINCKTQTLDKYKLADLKNLSFLQRSLIFTNNKDSLKEVDDIVLFLLKIFRNIIYKGSSSIESFECAKEIIAIFRKLSCYNLINNELMTKICINILKYFNFIRIIKSNFIVPNDEDKIKTKSTNDLKIKKDSDTIKKILFKLYYMIMKMIMNFIYNYNDNILNELIFNKEKYPDINSITLDNVCFLYKRNELGRFIYEINISILSSIFKDYDNFFNKKLILTKRIGMEIFHYSLNKADNYYLNIFNSINLVNYYYKFSKNLLLNKNQYYKDLIKQCNLLSNAFDLYFNFGQTIEEMLVVVNNALNFVFGGELVKKIISLDDDMKNGFNFSQKLTILSSNFFSLISRVIGIINHYQNRNKVFNDQRFSNNIKLNVFIQILPKKIEDEIIKKILYFYSCFIFNSPDTSLLILSHTIFIELTKLPYKYCQFVFKLFLTCTKNILDFDKENINMNCVFEQRAIIKRLFNYLEQLLEDKSIKENILLACIHYFLQILDIIIFNSFSSHFSIYNNFIYKIQYILIMINQKYNLINKFFEIKDNEFINKIKIDNRAIDLKDINLNEHQTFIQNNEKDKDNSLNFEFYKRNILQKSFVIYIKLINDCFDFSIPQDIKKIEDIININKVIFALKNYKINLDLRTEFLRLLRKILIDIKYSDDDNNLYTMTIINSKDNLKNIKNNQLINNMEYPTKLLSFVNNFYNTSAKLVLKEKIKRKKNVNNNKQKYNKIDKSDFSEKIENKNYSSINNDDFSNKRLKAILKKDNIINNSNYESLNIKNNTTKNYSDEQEFREYEEEFEKEKSFNDFDSNNSGNKSKVENKDNLLKNGVIVEESNPKLESDLYKSAVTNNKSIDKEENDTFGKKKIKGRMSLLDLNKKTLNKKNIRGDSKKSSFFFNQNIIMDKKTMKNLTNIPMKTNTVTLNEESEIDSEDLDYLVELIDQNDEEKFYSKCKEINILEEAFNNKFYDIIDYEIDNVKRFIENIKMDNPEKIEYIRNYIENGILIPIIFYFKKIFTLIHFFTGNEMIKIFSLLRKSINLKLYISTFNIDFWKTDNKSVNLENEKNIFFDKNEMTNSQNFYFTKYRNSSILNGFSFTDNKSIELTKQSLNYINSNKISIFDFSSLYQIIEKEFFSLIKDRKQLNILDIFKEKYNKSLNKNEMKNEEKLIEKNKSLLSELQKRLLKTLIIYKYSKLACFNEINSSFLSILPEITLGYETNFRNLLINILIFYGEEKSLKNEFIEISYFILFKLLSIQKNEIQNDIINILGGKESENPGFLKDFNNNLYSRIILLIINYLNPPDNLIQTSYFISCNLIHIFKMLCEEHNIFFQKHFIKSLSYSYIEDNSIYFKFSKNKEYDSSTFSNNSSKLSGTIFDDDLRNNNSEFTILFYDFFLFLLIKIILISNWDYKNNYLKKNPFLYDLFISILDLLNEIIQGTDYELMSSFYIDLNERMMEIIKAKEDNENYDYDEKFRKADSFEFFIKNIKSILFEEKNNYKFINEIRINLIHFITSILEEKNCNSVMKKYIKKYVDINNIYKIIGIVMKSYYLNKEKPKNFEKIQKSMNLMSSTKFIEAENNYEAPLTERRNSNYNPIFRAKMNILNNNNKSHNNNTLNTVDDNSISTSNIKLMNSTIIHKTLRKKMTLLNLDNRIEFKLFKTISTTVDENNETITNNRSTSVKENDKSNSINYNNNKEINKSKIKKYKTETKESNLNESIPMEFKIANLIFGKKLYNYFKNQFYENLEFTETLEFKLSNSFYRYIKIILFDRKKFENKVNIDQIKKIIDIEGDIFLEDLNDKDRFKKPNLKDNLNFEKDMLEKYYIQKFFEDITKIIEIRTDEGINKQIIYTKLPIMKFLSKETRKQFHKNANRDNETTKKNDLMKYIEYFIKEIKYFKKNYYKWDYAFSKIDFKYMTLISYLFALFYNLLLLLTIKGDNTISGLDKIKGRRQNELKINNLINYSVNQWSLIYRAFDYIYLILNLILILLWILYKLPLYYKIDQIKYKEIHICKNKKLSFYDKIYILFKMGFFDRNYISMLIYEFIINILCVAIKRSEIIYAFLLLPILFINKILKNIMISIRLNYHQFLLTFIFSFILAYIFSNFYFFFLNSDFYAELNYYNDNYCKTLAFAFLTALDGGLRARGGLGDLAKRISFSKNKKHYLFRIILDDLFFLSIVIIMIDMVFGIIIKSFDVLRHRNQKYHKDKKNYCYICHSNRDSLEKSRLNFEDHINIIHNLWNYVEYMISLKLKDIKDLNDTNKYVREKIDKKDITWLPTYKDINIKKDENYNDFDENNLIIYAENFCNYKIKSVDYN